MKKDATFSEKLRAVRESKGLTMYALAKAAGVSTQTMSALESGRNQPTWDTVQRLAAALGVSCEDFASSIELPELKPARGRGRPKAEGPKPKPKKRNQS